MKRFKKALAALLPPSTKPTPTPRAPPPSGPIPGWLKSPPAHHAPRATPLAHLYAASPAAAHPVPYPLAGPITLHPQPITARYTPTLTFTPASLAVLDRHARTALLFAETRNLALARRDAARPQAQARVVEARFVPLLNVQRRSGGGGGGLGGVWWDVSSREFAREAREGVARWGGNCAVVVRWAGVREEAAAAVPAMGRRAAVARPVAVARPAPVRHARSRPVDGARPAPVRPAMSRPPAMARSAGGAARSQRSRTDVADGRRNTIWPGPNAPKG